MRVMGIDKYERQRGDMDKVYMTDIRLVESRYERVSITLLFTFPAIHSQLLAISNTSAMLPMTL